METFDWRCLLNVDVSKTMIVAVNTAFSVDSFCVQYVCVCLCLAILAFTVM